MRLVLLCGTSGRVPLSKRRGSWSKSQVVWGGEVSGGASEAKDGVMGSFQQELHGHNKNYHISFVKLNGVPGQHDVMVIAAVVGEV